jgi:curved DNA-binding protein CbpA
MAKKYHPDAGEGSSAERFRAVQDAYDLLIDSEKRKKYDRGRETESRRSAPFVPHYQAPSVHLDLREVLRSPQRQTYAEPIEFGASRHNLNHVEDPWEELLQLLFRDF